MTVSLTEPHVDWGRRKFQMPFTDTKALGITVLVRLDVERHDN
jgi:hypothetical protein